MIFHNFSVWRRKRRSTRKFTGYLIEVFVCSVHEFETKMKVHVAANSHQKESEKNKIFQYKNEIAIACVAVVEKFQIDGVPSGVVQHSGK